MNKIRMNKIEGMTVSIDIYANFNLISENKMDEILNKLISKIGMKYAGLTQSGTFPSIINPNVNKGVTVSKIIVESHIAIHTFPESNYAHLDISTCKLFDINLAIDFLKDVFKTNEVSWKISYWENPK